MQDSFLAQKIYLDLRKESTERLKKKIERCRKKTNENTWWFDKAVANLIIVACESIIRAREIKDVV